MSQDFRIHAQLAESLRRLAAGSSVHDLNRETTMRSKLPAIPPPFGAVEQAHQLRQPVAILGHVTPDAVEYTAGERDRLDVPTVVRRANETQRNLTATAAEVRRALIPFAGRTIDLDAIDAMTEEVVARLRSTGRL